MDDSYMDDTMIESFFSVSDWEDLNMYDFKEVPNLVAALRYITHNWTELDVTI